MDLLVLSACFIYFLCFLNSVPKLILGDVRVLVLQNSLEIFLNCLIFLILLRYFFLCMNILSFGGDAVNNVPMLRSLKYASWVVFFLRTFGC